ncbi:MAG: ATP phosphoribosyltransferase [Rhodocyclaceae bacterium]|uniref:ATP phosphoribosyltransferase n=1 Tax=Candidatus Desulfobacillus denitrificans TaxID=2608985 RepID=A0A809RY44_9PROT|nr:MAG: ATP phosphoribosyltransferase [Rhodocyclaceae bacterium UTPRO2]BBO21116.1 ATP phosphoribosyltransferase [Candidatus Desulfobacillus denitrificans]GIK47242.1 MAG: ATP phosphoribosyltransferase [Betaproteobacteria bacterium]GJQ53537.1 MAG: ATP phosphoribosyltransferase [Rhodocyclaceae bacterium]
MSDAAPRLRLGIPKGSLQETTQKLFQRAGYDLRISGRSYYPDIDDAEIECILIRPQEMARYVEQGVLDCAITGLDWLLETGADVEELADLRAPWPNYGTVRWVMASKEGSPFNAVKDLRGRTIATEAVGMTKRFLAEHGVEANVEFSWGATEVKPPILADAIVDVSETGSSLRANRLRVMHVVLESTPRFIASRAATRDAWKRAKIERMLMLLRGAIAAATRVLLAMNVPKARVDAVLGILPALATPTVSTLSDPDWVDLSTVVAEKQVRELIPRLYEAGARGIIELPINKIIE